MLIYVLLYYIIYYLWFTITYGIKLMYYKLRKSLERCGKNRKMFTWEVSVFSSQQSYFLTPPAFF